MFGKGAPRCPRCNQAVYAAEEIIGAGQKWHVDCFTCKQCKTRISSTTLTEKDGEIFCSTCYAKNYGPKGFGIGGASVHTGVTIADPVGTKTAANVYGGYAGAAAASSPPSRPAPMASSAASPSAGGGTCCGVRANGAFCGQCGKKVQAGAASSPTPAAFSPPPAAAAPSPVKNWNQGIVRPPPMQAAPTGDRCGNCKERVYDAEKVVGGGKIWHSACFRCTTCRTGLSSTNIADRDDKLYCSACYGKNFGPKGFGFAGGSAGAFGATR